jgi:hypothetical protein
MLSRLVVGARFSFLWGLSSQAPGGILMGLSWRVFLKWADTVIMRIMDASAWRFRRFHILAANPWPVSDKRNDRRDHRALQPQPCAFDPKKRAFSGP